MCFWAKRNNNKNKFAHKNYNVRTPRSKICPQELHLPIKLIVFFNCLKDWLLFQHAFAKILCFEALLLLIIFKKKSSNKYLFRDREK